MKKLAVLFIALMSQLLVAQQKPNVIFLLADDMGYGDIGSTGQKLIETPNIDQLAKEGLLMTDFYAGAPVCGPSRSVLITGLHTGHTTIRGNNVITGGKKGYKKDKIVYRANLHDTDYTIGDLMQQSGYHTGMVGKWHLGGYDTAATPLHHGFDEFYGWLINKPETYASTYWPDKRYVNGTVVDVPKNAKGKKGYYHTSMCTDEALAFLKNQKDAEKPFMLMVNYSNPHAPLDAPDNAIYDKKDWPKDMKTYAAMIYYLDQSVAQIKTYLEESGLADNTILIFTSDNGPRSNYSDQLTEVVDYFDSNAKLRGYKRDMYEGGIRVPTIIWSPKKVAPNQINSTPFYFADVMPTFADIANSDVKFHSDGSSFYPIIKGAKMLYPPRFMYWEFFENGFEQAVRFGKWKGVKHKGRFELYNLEEDLSEEHDVSAQYPEIIALMEEYLAGCRTESPYWPVDAAKD